MASFTRLSTPALQALADTHLAELQALPLRDERDLSPQQRTECLGLDSLRSSSYPRATDEYLETFFVCILTLDSPPSAHARPHVNSLYVRIYVEHAAWLAALAPSMPKHVSLMCCGLTVALEAARRSGWTAVRVSNTYELEIVTDGSRRILFASMTLLEQAEAVGRDALAAYSWSLYHDAPQRWRALTNVRAPLARGAD